MDQSPWIMIITSYLAQPLAVLRSCVNIKCCKHIMLDMAWLCLCTRLTQINRYIRVRLSRQILPKFRSHIELANKIAYINVNRLKYVIKMKCMTGCSLPRMYPNQRHTACFILPAPHGLYKRVAKALGPFQNVTRKLLFFRRIIKRRHKLTR